MSEVSWAHFSDLHTLFNPEQEDLKNFLLYGKQNFYNDTTSDEQLLDSRGVRGFLAKHPVDQIIITGDLFDKGMWDAETVNSVETFICALYDSSNEGWENRGIGKKTGLLLCAGNHDLTRDYVEVDKGTPVSRRNAIQRLSKSDSGSISSANSADLLVLNGAFKPFCEAAKRILSKVEGDTNCINKNICISFVENINDIAFIGINSALSAGQPRDNANDRERLSTTFNNFLNAHSRFELQKAQNSYKSYVDLASMMINGAPDDEKHLLLPPETELTSIGRATWNSAIAYMHHPIEFFNDRARSRLGQFLRDNHVRIVLCGHTHRPSINSTLPVQSTALNHDPYKVIESRVGGCFADASDYNLISFSIGKMSSSINFDGQADNISIHTFSYMSSPAFINRWFWREEKLETRYPTQDETNGGITVSRYTQPQNNEEAANSQEGVSVFEDSSENDRIKQENFSSFDSLEINQKIKSAKEYFDGHRRTS